MPKFIHKTLIVIALSCVLAGCLPAALPPTQSPETPPAETPSIETTEAVQPDTPSEPGDLPLAVEYNLGEATIAQSMFPEDSRFYTMPVRLNGIIAAPSGEDGPYPVVIILHGNHPGCPIPEGDMVDRWPCDPEVERPNYRGFDYLVSRLAAEGYVALSINVNAEYTFGFGEPIPGERLEQLVDLHLKALAEASSGGSNQFGVDLQSLADMSRLAFIGHSQGAEGAYFLFQKVGLDAPDAFERLGYGPAHGLLMVAPSANIAGAGVSRVPFSVILPACDRDVINQEGQLFYEITRLGADQIAWASSVWLEGANHNYFNSTLSDEALARPDRPDCVPLMEAETDRDFLSEYTLDFLANIFDLDTGTMARLGMDLQAVAPDELYGLPARVVALAPRYDRLPVFLPGSASELETNLAGGSVTAENLTVTYCEQGYFIPAERPGSEPCKRVNLVVPANPAMLVASWSQSGGALRFALPGGHDLSQFKALSLRAAVDPLSTLNESGAYQAFTIQLVDQQGSSAVVRTRVDEPALRFPDGIEEENESFEGGLFTGRVPLTSVRLLLSDFDGVNLAEIGEINILFDQTASGTLFISDLELVR